MEETSNVTFVLWGGIELFHNFMKVVPKSTGFPVEENSERSLLGFLIKAIVQNPVTFKGKIKS